MLDALKAGASGWWTAAPNLRTAVPGPVRSGAGAGNLDKAQLLYDDLKPLLEFIVAGGLPTTVKAGLDLLGFPIGDRGRRCCRSTSRAGFI